MDAGNRIIALGASTLSKVSDHRVQQEKIRLEVGDTWHDNGLIFPSKIGTPFDPRNLLRDFKNVLEGQACRICTSMLDSAMAEGIDELITSVKVVIREKKREDAK